MSWDEPARPRSARSRLLEREWDALAAEKTRRTESPRQKLDRALLEERLSQMSVTELQRIWLHLQRIGQPPEDF